MSGRPFALAATLIRSARESDQKSVRSGMSLENLERDDPAIREGDGFVRHRDARRYVGVKERIEERIADKHKSAVMEMVHTVGTDESKPYTNQIGRASCRERG